MRKGADSRPRHRSEGEFFSRAATASPAGTGLSKDMPKIVGQLIKHVQIYSYIEIQFAPNPLRKGPILSDGTQGAARALRP